MGFGGEVVGLGANAMFNPWILQRSGYTHHLLGKRLHEQTSVSVEVDLNGLEGFDGSTVFTAHAYNIYDGEHRKERAACIIEISNAARLRAVPGRFREVLRFKCLFDVIPDDQSWVKATADRPEMPVAHFHGFSDYTHRSIKALPKLLDAVLAPLPVEAVRISPTLNDSEAHVMGTALMGSDRAHSVVDDALVSHDLRNVLVLGSSAFPQATPSNPTLTLSALSVRAADRVFGRQT